jgi:hypothetical protein
MWLSKLFFPLEGNDTHAGEVQLNVHALCQEHRLAAEPRGYPALVRPRKREERERERKKASKQTNKGKQTSTKACFHLRLFCRDFLFFLSFSFLSFLSNPFLSFLLLSFSFSSPFHFIPFHFRSVALALHYIIVDGHQ